MSIRDRLLFFTRHALDLLSIPSLFACSFSTHNFSAHSQPFARSTARDVALDLYAREKSLMTCVYGHCFSAVILNLSLLSLHSIVDLV
jgi:hypothetical protein